MKVVELNIELSKKEVEMVRTIKNAVVFVRIERHLGGNDVYGSSSLVVKSLSLHTLDESVSSNNKSKNTSLLPLSPNKYLLLLLIN